MTDAGMTDAGMTGAGARVAGVVLAAGGSMRLGEAKQLLPYRGRTLLDATLDMARSCGFGQLLVMLGGSASQIRTSVDLSGCEVGENPDFSDGCGSSIRSAIPLLKADAVVLLLGDQPGISPDAVRRVMQAPTPIAVCRYDADPPAPIAVCRNDADYPAPVAVCRYDADHPAPVAVCRNDADHPAPDGHLAAGPADPGAVAGIGADAANSRLAHPFLFRRSTFSDLSVLHGDKAVWKLLHSGAYPVTTVPVDGPVPLDVDTRDDYRRLLAGDRR